MSDNRKPRSDSILRTLPEARQTEIAEHLRDHSYDDTVKWLAADGLRVSRSALSEFFSWYGIRRMCREAESGTRDIVQLFHKEFPEASQEKLSALGDMVFQLQALKGQDPKTFLAFQTAKHRARMDVARLEQREREIKLAERKVVMQEAKTKAHAAVETAAKAVKLDDATKRQILDEIDRKLLGT